MNIVFADDPVLWNRSKTVNNPANQVIPFLHGMRTLMKLNNAKCISAPQVGLPLRFFLMDELIIINPYISKTTGCMVGQRERVVTWPDRVAESVMRPVICEASWTNERNTTFHRRMRGFPARLFQQMFNTLEGKHIFPQPQRGV